HRDAPPARRAPRVGRRERCRSPTRGRAARRARRQRPPRRAARAAHPHRFTPSVAARDGADGVPDRAGGVDEHAEARRWRAPRVGDDRLPRRRGRAAHRGRRRRGRGARRRARGRGPGTGRDAGAGRGLRRVGGDWGAAGWRVPRRRPAHVLVMTIRILLDDQPMLRMGFRMVFDAQPDLEVVGEAADGVDALAVLEHTPADVVLMDVRMPRMDGVEATKRIAAMPEPTPRVVILTTFDLDEYVFAGLRAGASAFLLKDVPPEELLHAIRVVASGDAIVAPSVTRRLLDQFVPHLPADGVPAPAAGAPPSDPLTDREREVLLQVARGLSNAEVAAALFLSEATVKTHVGHILTKLGLRDRVQLVIHAYETGLVAPNHRSA